MKDIYVADLSGFDESKIFDSFFLVLHKQHRTTKTNKPYLSLFLGDKTGQVEARVWEPGDPRIAKEFERGDIVKARGCVSRFDDRLQMKVDQLRKAAAGEADKTDLLPCTTCDVDELWRRLLGFVESFTDPNLKLLLNTILADSVLAQAYREAPAAKQLHHAWLGGLLEHVISLLTLADRLLRTIRFCIAICCSQASFSMTSGKCASWHGTWALNTPLKARCLVTFRWGSS